MPFKLKVFNPKTLSLNGYLFREAYRSLENISGFNFNPALSIKLFSFSDEEESKPTNVFSNMNDQEIIDQLLDFPDWKDG